MNAAFCRPRSLGEALQAMAEGVAMPLAGGTDILPGWANGAVRRPLVDLSSVPERAGHVGEDADGWYFGAMTTWSQLAAARLPPYFDAAKQAALEVGGRQIQNRGTLVGNVCNASPAADGVTALVCLEAVVRLRSLRGARSVALADFVTGNRQTARAADELVTGLTVPRRGPDARSVFRKLGARRYLVISIAMVAVLLEGSKREMKHVAIAAGSCSAKPVRMASLERGFAGGDANRLAAAAAAGAALPELTPISDVRASSAYRAHAARTLIAGAVADCAALLP